MAVNIYIKIFLEEKYMDKIYYFCTGVTCLVGVIFFIMGLYGIICCIKNISNITSKDLIASLVFFAGGAIIAMIGMIMIRLYMLL